MKTTLLLIGLFCIALGALGAELSPQARAAKARAYEFYEQKQFSNSAEQFRAYLAEAPEDFNVTIDYAGVLAELGRHGEAARLLETVHARQPGNEAAYFKLGTVYLGLDRFDDAQKVFAELEKSRNRDMATAAREALARLREDCTRETRTKTEERIYKLANEFKHEEVVREVDKLERSGKLSWGMEMQRIYSMVSLKRYAPALRHANRLERQEPDAPDLALVRADLYNQLGSRAEAVAIWRKLERGDNAAAAEAKRRLAEPIASPSPEDRVYAFARENKNHEVIRAVDELERKGPISPAMELQRLYALQAIGEREKALAQLEKLSQKYPDKPELALARADLLIAAKRWREASELLGALAQKHRDTPVEVEARNRLAAIPEIANLKKWYWGEAYLSGDYLGRFGTVVGSGFARHGYYIPEVRWLQPYAEMRFSADTRSGAGRRSTIITDNFLGFYGGMRAQLFETEYLFVYGQGGINKDFLARREDGDWALDYQVGIYGFKSWGPGTTLLTPSAVISTSGGMPAAADADQTAQSKSPGMNDIFWRGDWFVDAGADFSYYHRYSSWIGYGQAHEGFRLLQLGPSVAIDGYLVENLAWDVRGNFYDNLFEIGPGARLLWVPRRRWEVVLRAEWLHGWYLGRDDLDNRGDTDSRYDNVHVGLSVGIRW